MKHLRVLAVCTVHISWFVFENWRLGLISVELIPTPTVQNNQKWDILFTFVGRSLQM